MKHFYLDSFEIVLGKPLNLTVNNNGEIISIKTEKVTEKDLEQLIKSGVVEVNDDFSNLTVGDVVKHYVERKHLEEVESKRFFLWLQKYAPTQLFTLIVKEVAIMLDSQYYGYIGDCNELYGISLNDFNVYQLTGLTRVGLYNTGVFRSVNDAKLALAVAKPIIAQIEESVRK